MFFDMSTLQSNRQKSLYCGHDISLSNHGWFAHNGPASLRVDQPCFELFHACPHAIQRLLSAMPSASDARR